MQLHKVVDPSDGDTQPETPERIAGIFKRLQGSTHNVASLIVWADMPFDRRIRYDRSNGPYSCP